jgi:predicted phage terminase large subunit-like protein
LEFESSFAYIDIADEGTDYLCCVIGKNIGTDVYITDIVFSDSNTDITLPLCAKVLRENKVSYCRVESNSMGAMFGRNLQKLLDDTQILAASSTTHKHTRILNDSVSICEYFRFKHEDERDPMYHNAIGQLRLYTKDGKAKHDDMPDACSGLMNFIRSMLSHLY